MCEPVLYFRGEGGNRGPSPMATLNVSLAVVSSGEGAAGIKATQGRVLSYLPREEN